MSVITQKGGSRQALTKPNLSYYLWRFASNSSRARRELFSTKSFPESTKIAGEIAQRGIVVGSSAKFLSPEGQQALNAASQEVLQISNQPEVQDIATGKVANEKLNKDFIIHLISRDKAFSKDSPVVKVAADKKLLEIVSSYLGMWPRLHAASAWLNYPTEGEAKTSQLWHRDPEDMKIVKVFIYLVDVDEHTGPFSYIPETQPFGAAAGKAAAYEKQKRVLDDELSSVYPRESWQSCTGPAHTMILADTVGYHRGGKPSTGNRILITFTFTSGTPYVERNFRMDGRPDWATDPIQDYALSL